MYFGKAKVQRAIAIIVEDCLSLITPLKFSLVYLRTILMTLTKTGLESLKTVV